VYLSSHAVKRAERDSAWPLGFFTSFCITTVSSAHKSGFYLIKNTVNIVIVTCLGCRKHTAKEMKKYKVRSSHK